MYIISYGFFLLNHMDFFLFDHIDFIEDSTFPLDHIMLGTLTASRGILFGLMSTTQIIIQVSLPLTFEMNYQNVEDVLVWYEQIKGLRFPENAKIRRVQEKIMDRDRQTFTFFLLQDML